VQIAAGAHHVGDLGVVSHSKDGLAEVLLDTTEATVRVLVNNLTETSDTRTGLQTFGRYSLNQLVQLTDNEVGMIVRISADAAQLLMPSAYLTWDLLFCSLLSLSA
jgi:transcription elongation factor